VKIVNKKTKITVSILLEKYHKRRKDIMKNIKITLITAMIIAGWIGWVRTEDKIENQTGTIIIPVKSKKIFPDCSHGRV